VRGLAAELRQQGLHIIEVVEGARVPIIKCLYREEDERREHGEGKSEEPFEQFEVDISFCNEVAYHNSRLLRAYADFDPRVVQVCRLVKLWAKRRKINSPFDGTLSSYAYSLMVIHYFQRVGVLPNLQQPRFEVLQDVGLEHGFPTEILEGGHNAWFLHPISDAWPFLRRVDEGHSPPSDQEEAMLEEEEKRWLLGSEPRSGGVLDFLYGFFRYFGLEHNMYTDIISIRSNDERILKINFFMAQALAEQAQGGEGGEHAHGEVADEEAQKWPEDLAEVTMPEMQSEDPDMPADQPEQLPKVSEDFRTPSPVVTGKETDDPDDEAFLRAADDLGELDSMLFEKPKACEDEAEEARGGAGQPEEEPEVPKKEEALESFAEQLQAPLPIMGTADDDEGLEAADSAEADEQPSEATLLGSVRSYSSETGFGFIACEATFARYKRDVFLHAKQATGIRVGDHVTFVVELNGRGQPQARQVRKLDSEALERVLESGGAHQLEGLAVGGQEARTSEELLRATAVAQHRLKDRTCLCIDDPMERHRTLGTSFAGQELLSKELRRALSLLKNAMPGCVDEVFKERDVLQSRIAPRRECSPMPAQRFMTADNTLVQLQRRFPKSLIGRVIGHQGSTIRHIREQSSVDVRVDTQEADQAVISFTGRVENVQLALDMTDRVLHKKPESRRGQTTKESPSSGQAGDVRSKSFSSTAVPSGAVAAPGQLAGSQSYYRGAAAAGSDPIGLGLGRQHQQQPVRGLLSTPGTPPGSPGAASGSFIASGSSAAMRSADHLPPGWPHHNVMPMPLPGGASPQSQTAALGGPPMTPPPPGQLSFYPARRGVPPPPAASGPGRPLSSGVPPTPPPPPRRGADGLLRSSQEQGAASQVVPVYQTAGLAVSLTPQLGSELNGRGPKSPSLVEPRLRPAGIDAGSPTEHLVGGEQAAAPPGSGTRCGRASASNKVAQPMDWHRTQAESHRERPVGSAAATEAEAARAAAAWNGGAAGHPPGTSSRETERASETTQALLREEEQERRRSGGRGRGKDGTLRGSASVASAATSSSPGAKAAPGSSNEGSAADEGTGGAASQQPIKAKSKHNKIAWQ